MYLLRFFFFVKCFDWKSKNVRSLYFLDLMPVHKLCRLSRGRGVAPKTIYYIDLLNKKDDKGSGSKIADFETT